jgi:hypothetical protein
VLRAFNLGELLVLLSIAALWWAYGRGASRKTWAVGGFLTALFIAPRLLNPAMTGILAIWSAGLTLPAVAAVRPGAPAGLCDGHHLPASGGPGWLGAAAAGGWRLRPSVELPGFPGPGCIMAAA